MEAVANGSTAMSVAYQDLVRGVTTLALLGADRVVVECSGGTLRLGVRRQDTGGVMAVVAIEDVVRGELPPVEVPLRALAADVDEEERCHLELTSSCLVVRTGGYDYMVPGPARMVHGPDPLASRQRDPWPAGELSGTSVTPLARALTSVALDDDPLDVGVLDPGGFVGARGPRRFAITPLEHPRLDDRVAVPGRLIKVANAFRPDRVHIVVDQAPAPGSSCVRLCAVEGPNLCVLEAPLAAVPAASLVRFLQDADVQVPILAVSDAHAVHQVLDRFSEFARVVVAQDPGGHAMLVGTDESGEQLSAFFAGSVWRGLEVSPMDLRFLLSTLHGPAVVCGREGGSYPLRLEAEDGSVRGLLYGD